MRVEQGECSNGEEGQHLYMLLPRGPQGHQGPLEAALRLGEAGKVRSKSVDVAEDGSLHGRLVQVLKKLQDWGGGGNERAGYTMKGEGGLGGMMKGEGGLGGMMKGEGGLGGMMKGGRWVRWDDEG